MTQLRRQKGCGTVIAIAIIGAAILFILASSASALWSHI